VNVSYSRQWVPVARDLKARLSPILEFKKDRLEQLMIWCDATLVLSSPLLGGVQHIGQGCP
jgi:hypothetical protein